MSAKKQQCHPPLSVEHLYTPLDESVDELHRRRADAHLCRKLRQFQEQHPPPFLNGAAHTMFSRHIFSADFEFQRYVELAARTKLNPLCLEITKDRFASINPDKHRRGKMAFRLTKQVRSLRVIDFGCDGTCIADVRTLASQPLVEYHHQLLTEFHPNFINSIVDASDWLLAGGRIKPGYHHYLALAIADGILFENFLPDDAQERSFLIERVLPSFDFLVAHFGVKPLIVRLFTKEQEQEPWIWQYPGEVYPLAHDLVTRRYSDSSDPYAS